MELANDQAEFKYEVECLRVEVEDVAHGRCGMVQERDAVSSCYDIAGKRY